MVDSPEDMVWMRRWILWLLLLLLLLLSLPSGGLELGSLEWRAWAVVDGVMERWRKRRERRRKMRGERDRWEGGRWRVMAGWLAG